MSLHTQLGKCVVTGAVLSAFAVSGALAETGPQVTHAYGADPAQELDSYSPSGSDHPILIFVHGGSWYVGDKEQKIANKKEGLIGSEDYVFVSINYRSGYDTNWEGQSADIRDAIDWVHDNAASIGGDEDKIFLMGHSSGAHMAALVAMDDDFGIRENLAGIALLDSGDYDVVGGYNHCSGSSCDKYDDFWDNYNTTSMAEGSPVNHADDNVVAPTILIHRNTAFKIGQADDLNDAINDGGQTNVEQYSTNDSHSDINEFIGATGYSYTTQVSGFFDDILSGGGGGSGSALLEDDFENYNSNGWTTDGIVNSGEFHSSSNAWKCRDSDSYLISPNLDTSSASTIEVSLYYRDHGIDDSDDVFLQLYDGSGYDNFVELGVSASNNTWTLYSTTLDVSTDPDYFITDFKLKVECSGIDILENLRIDDVLVEID